jgi:predicted Fe-S protein YdhL (DUF1289 family)
MTDVRTAPADAQAAGVPSPCIDVCRMNPDTQWCDGCLRTLDEIRGWSFFDDDAKRAVWAQLDARHASLIGALREDLR